MQNAHTIDLLIGIVEKHGTVEGIEMLSELSGVEEFTIKANGNINKLNNHDHIDHSRKGPRKKHVWKYVTKPQNYDNKIVIVNEEAIEVKTKAKLLFKQWRKLRKKNLSAKEQMLQESKAIELQKQIAITSNRMKYLKMFLHPDTKQSIELSEKRMELYRLDEKINKEAFLISKNMAERIYVFRFY